MLHVTFWFFLFCNILVSASFGVGNHFLGPRYLNHFHRSGSIKPLWILIEQNPFIDLISAHKAVSPSRNEKDLMFSSFMFPMTSRTLRCAWVFTTAFVATRLSLMGFLSTWDLMRILGGNSTHFYSRLSQFRQNDNKKLKTLFKSIYKASPSDNSVFPTV